MRPVVYQIANTLPMEPSIADMWRSDSRSTSLRRAGAAAKREAHPTRPIRDSTEDVYEPASASHFTQPKKIIGDLSASAPGSFTSDVERPLDSSSPGKKGDGIASLLAF
jgi:hypothetical protein